MRPFRVLLATATCSGPMFAAQIATDMQGPLTSGPGTAQAKLRWTD